MDPWISPLSLSLFLFHFCLSPGTKTKKGEEVRAKDINGLLTEELQMNIIGGVRGERNIYAYATKTGRCRRLLLLHFFSFFLSFVLSSLDFTSRSFLASSHASRRRGHFALGLAPFSGCLGNDRQGVYTTGKFITQDVID